MKRARGEKDGAKRSLSHALDVKANTFHTTLQDLFRTGAFRRNGKDPVTQNHVQCWERSGNSGKKLSSDTSHADSDPYNNNC